METESVEVKGISICTLSNFVFVVRGELWGVASLDLFLGVESMAGTFLILDACVAAEDRFGMLAVVIIDGSCGGGCGVGSLLGALGRSRVRIFGLGSCTLALVGRSGGLGRVVVSITVRLRLGRGGSFLGARLHRGFGAGSLLSVGVATFSIGEFRLDSFAMLARSCQGKSSLIVILRVSFGGSFSLGFSGGGRRSSSIDGSAIQNFLLDT